MIYFLQLKTLEGEDIEAELRVILRVIISST